MFPISSHSLKPPTSSHLSVVPASSSIQNVQQTCSMPLTYQVVSCRNNIDDGEISSTSSTPQPTLKRKLPQSEDNTSAKKTTCGISPNTLSTEGKILSLSEITSGYSIHLLPQSPAVHMNKVQRKKIIFMELIMEFNDWCLDKVAAELLDINPDEYDDFLKQAKLTLPFFSPDEQLARLTANEKFMVKRSNPTLTYRDIVFLLAEKKRLIPPSLKHFLQTNAHSTETENNKIDMIEEIFIPLLYENPALLETSQSG